MTLTTDVTTYWNQCLAVNSSWREFTHSLAILNTFDCLHIEDVEFVAELLGNTELFEFEGFAELALACYDFASELVIEPEDIDCADLTYLTESGLTVTEVIELASEYGVSAVAISDFAECS
jgi:hypothetical protein